MEQQARISTVWIVTKLCGCTVLRTLDKDSAVDLAKRNGYLLDAITCRTSARERLALSGDIVLSCNCASLQSAEEDALEDWALAGPAVG